MRATLHSWHNIIVSHMSTHEREIALVAMHLQILKTDCSHNTGSYSDRLSMLFDYVDHRLLVSDDHQGARRHDVI